MSINFFCNVLTKSLILQWPEQAAAGYVLAKMKQNHFVPRLHICTTCASSSKTHSRRTVHAIHRGFHTVLPFPFNRGGGQSPCHPIDRWTVSGVCQSCVNGIPKSCRGVVEWSLCLLWIGRLCRSVLWRVCCWSIWHKLWGRQRDLEVFWPKLWWRWVRLRSQFYWTILWTMCVWEFWKIMWNDLWM